jgi:DNA-directed RNA polymerase specialized sigma24 family protein
VRAALDVGGRMSRDLVTAFSLLPPPYAAALRLRLDGATPADVGAALDVDAAAVGSLLVVAEAKLRELMLTSSDDPERSNGPTRARLLTDP